MLTYTPNPADLVYVRKNPSLRSTLDVFQGLAYMWAKPTARNIMNDIASYIICQCVNALSK